jgi:hypothetical protein
VELSFMPRDLAMDLSATVFDYKAYISPPRDWDLLYGQERAVLGVAFGSRCISGPFFAKGAPRSPDCTEKDITRSRPTTQGTVGPSLCSLQQTPSPSS